MATVRLRQASGDLADLAHTPLTENQGSWTMGFVGSLEGNVWSLEK
jgi:hypothetical protein